MATIINLNDTTPAAPAGAVNVKWQADPVPALASTPRNVSAYVQNAPFVMAEVNSGVVGTDVALMNPARTPGPVTQCVVRVAASDPSVALTFDVTQNGTSVFSAPLTIAAGTAADTISEHALVSASVAVAKRDLFKMNITSGSSAWKYTMQLE